MKKISECFSRLTLSRLFLWLSLALLASAFLFALLRHSHFADSELPGSAWLQDHNVLTALIASGLLLFLVFLFMRRFVVVPLAKLAHILEDMSGERELGTRVVVPAWPPEVLSLGAKLRHLLDTMDNNQLRLQELSVRDPLTGLYTRHRFHACLQNEIVRASRHGRGFSVVLVDLDDFKNINASMGHPSGDMLLKEISMMLGLELRQGDVLARFEGDKFAILLPETEVARGFRVASKLHQGIADKLFDLPSGKMRITASFSMVSYPEDGKTDEQIYAAMDTALFKAKAQGKNRVMTADASGDRIMKIIFRQGDFLRNALRESRVEAFLQPIVNVQDGTVEAYEVLGRIRDGETVAPAQEFADVAEELGMAHDLDREVFRKGLAHYQTIANSHPQAKLFFNLFPSSFLDIAWIRGIPDMVRAAGVPPEAIVLEITEREALPNLNQVAEVIRELRADRISVALDDFGSGFSSFLYLKFLSIDYVKIEGSFIREIANDKRDRIMVEHINEMAHQFGLRTVAEFVEDEATAKVLAEIGVDFAQGYHFGRPALPE
ncbi:MAG: bifunctional diguanylate cyclase/phosphodiesterase [Gallionella sp.]